MPDTKPFQPFKPEKKVTMEVTIKEKQVIEMMRKSHFGKFTVHKLNGTLVRVEKDESIMLTEEEPVESSQPKVL